MFPNLCLANAQDGKCDQNTVFAQGSNCNQIIVFVQYRKCDQNITLAQVGKCDQFIVFLQQVTKYDRNTDLLKKVDMIQIIKNCSG